jgi:hypothetical protein
MQRSEDVLKIFPLLLPSSSDFSSYRGMITIHVQLILQEKSKNLEFNITFKIEPRVQL